MKLNTSILLILVLLLAAVRVPAQDKTVKPAAGQAVSVNTVITPSPAVQQIVQAAANEAWVEIYEFPDYQGRKVRFGPGNHVPVLPFTPDRVSVKRCRNSIVQVKMTNGYGGTAQKIMEDIPGIRINNDGITGISVEILPYVEVFEFPDYKGRSVRFTEDIPFLDNLGLPFSMREISVRLSNELLTATFSARCGSNGGVWYMEQSQPRTAFSQTVCGLKVGRKMGIRMRFNGILTEFHNNDCRKGFGKIRIRIVQKDETGKTVQVCTPYRVSPQESGWVTVFDVNRTMAGEGGFFDIRRFPPDEPGRPADRRKPRLFRLPLNEDEPYVLFSLDSTAFLTGKYQLEVEAELGTHHKQCDLCSDYTPHAEMRSPLVKSARLLPFELGGGYAQVGDFRPAGSGIAGPPHQTYIDFSYTGVSYIYASTRR